MSDDTQQPTVAEKDPIDAAVVLVSERGDRILTSDPEDIRRLAGHAGRRVAIIAC